MNFEGEPKKSALMEGCDKILYVVTRNIFHWSSTYLNSEAYVPKSDKCVVSGRQLRGPVFIRILPYLLRIRCIHAREATV